MPDSKTLLTARAKGVAAIIKFSDVLASSIHDIKNALGMITNTIEELTLNPDSGLAGNPKLMRLQLESQRANHDLIQLLALYKHENAKLTPNITENNLDDFIEDIAIENRALAEARGINIDTRCDSFLSAYFDENLIRGVINNAVGNSQRYTRDRILLSTDVCESFVVIRVEDNGDGFPAEMLEFQEAIGRSENFNQGRTQLGLYFAKLIAQMHTNQQQQGFIRLENNHILSGSCFSLWLP